MTLIGIMNAIIQEQPIEHLKSGWLSSFVACAIWKMDEF